MNEQEQDLAKLLKQAEKARTKLANIGAMRPGKLTQQYKDSKEKTGGYWQLNYTYQMKSRTEYVRPESLPRIRQETATFKRFKELIDALIDLELRISTIRSAMDKKKV